MPKETLTAKVSPKNLERLEEYAEREGISKSEATDRLVKQGLDVEESDMRLVPVKADGGTIIEDRLDEIERHQQNRLNDIEQGLKIQSESFGRLGYFVSMALAWIGIDMAFNMPTWLVVVSGTALVIGLIWNLYEYREEVEA